MKPSRCAAGKAASIGGLNQRMPAPVAAVCDRRWTPPGRPRWAAVSAATQPAPAMLSVVSLI